MSKFKNTFKALIGGEIYTFNSYWKEAKKITYRSLHTGFSQHLSS